MTQREVHSGPLPAGTLAAAALVASEKMCTTHFWAMPILHDDRLIGTVDPRLEREAGRLVVDRVVAEQGAPRGRAVARAIARAVEELAAFVGAREVRWPRKLPVEWRS